MKQHLRFAGAAFCFLSAGSLYSLPAEAQPATPPPANVPDSAQATQSIDLPTTLRLAGANNLDLALIKQALAQAQAQNDAASLAFVPWISGGFGYTKHNGAIQDVAGNVVDVHKQLHSDSVGLNAQVNVGNALFEKLAADRLQSAAEYNVDAGLRKTVSAAAGGYFELVGALANAKIAQDAVRISTDYEAQINRAVEIGLANKSDALRVGVQTQGYQAALRQAQAAARIASARLATILHLNPAIIFQPVDAVAPQVTLVKPDVSLDALMHEAVETRPELKSSAASLDAADWQKKESIYGPMIPSISAQALAGNINGGPAGPPPKSGGDQDYGLMLNWRIGPGGLLDFSRIDSADSKLEQARISDAKLHDDVVRQVVQEFEGLHAAADQVTTNKTGVDLAGQALQLSQGRRDFGVAAVLEVIQAQKDLVQAQAGYNKALTDYAEAQYRLAEAVGRLGTEP